MNVETGEIKPMADLTPEWVPVTKRQALNNRAFNGRHREARIAKFNGALARKKAGRKSQRKMKQASQRRNRA